jgi:hypothetical protein
LVRSSLKAAPGAIGTTTAGVKSRTKLTESVHDNLSAAVDTSMSKVTDGFKKALGSPKSQPKKAEAGGGGDAAGSGDSG